MPGTEPHAPPDGERRGWWPRFGSALPYALLAVAALWLWWPHASGPKSGAPAADFELPVVTTEGKRFHLAAHRGSPVLIEVFASWCGVCRTSAPTLAEVAQAERARAVQIVAISVDDEPGSALAAAHDWNLGVDVVHADAQFVRDYGISTLPTFILVDEAGTVREVASGGLSRNRLERWLSSVGAPRK